MFPELSVIDNLRLGAYARRRRRRGAPDRALLERFAALKARRHQRAGLLSGGEQQMLAIARGLMARPRVLMLDEPSLGLAPKLVEGLYDLLAELRDEGTTILLVDQMAALALSVADRAYVLQSGTIQHSGSARGAARGPGADAQAYLGDHGPHVTGHSFGRKDRHGPHLAQRAAASAPSTTPTDIGIAGGTHRRHPAGPRRRRRDASISAAAWCRRASIETHIHLDKSCILDRCKAERGDLEEAIGEVGQGQEGVHPGGRLHSRAEAHAGEGILNGTTHMRTHLEVDPGIGLRGLEGVLPLIEGISNGRSTSRSASSRRRACSTIRAPTS